VGAGFSRLDDEGRVAPTFDNGSHRPASAFPGSGRLSHSSSCLVPFSRAF